MAALLRGLRAGRALRSLGSVAVQTAASPQCSSVRRGLHCAALLRHQDDPKNPSSSSSTTYHEHYQAHSSAQDTSASASADEGTSASTHEASEGATETGKQNTSYQDQSGEQNEDYETEEQLAERILTAALDFVPQYGWTVEAIAAGAETLGLSSATTGMFYNGAGDLVLHFVGQCNAQLTEVLAEQHKQVQLGQAEKLGKDVLVNDSVDLHFFMSVDIMNASFLLPVPFEKPPIGPKKTAEFLRDAVETRLRMLIPYIDTWPQAMSILILPHNIPHSLKHLSTLMDDIWYYAGDRSTDMNWYTKRAALTGIYNTTELVMLQDSSPDFQDTWTFLDNRIQDVVNMASTAKQVQSTGEAVAQGLMGAAITLKNMTGLNQRR